MNYKKLYILHKKEDENELQINVVQDTITLLVYANFNKSI